MDYFADSPSHLLAELRRIDLLIQAHVRQARALQNVDPQFQGLYVSDSEIDRLSASLSGLPEWAAQQLPDDTQDALDRAAEWTDALAEESARLGIELRLSELSRAFGLSRVEVDILLIALAPEIDLRYEKFYAYLQDDVTRKQATIDLVLNLLCRSMDEKLALRTRFGSQSPLLLHGLIEFGEDAPGARSSLPAKTVKVDRGIVNYLGGEAAISDGRLAASLRIVEPVLGFEDLLLPPELPDGLRTLYGDRGVLHFRGPAGAGKKSCAEAMCRERGLRLAIVDGSQFVQATDFESHLRLLTRECRLHRTLLYVDAFDAFLDETKRPRYELLLRVLTDRDAITIVAGEEAWTPPGILLSHRFAQIEFGVPPYETRLALWKRAAGFTNADLEALANQFSFTCGQILESVAIAGNLAQLRGGGETSVTTTDLLAACRSRSNAKLSRVARHIVPQCSWKDLVLPSDRLRQLREICNAVQHRGRVYDSWGFGRKLYGRGINILFAGSSGTGKTMAAEAMASELGLDLYKIDLSTVVSKYIGETEKNLSKIFTEARSSNAILFFDEADALFGKRTAVEDAHDRYANIETNYLLQKMEEHDGLAVLATNLGKNMDDAFTRRLHATIEFPMPGLEDRLQIWCNVWPADAPKDPNLDLEFMARRFEISGGSIRNIALLAAFLAASDGARPIEMGDLIRATKLEYQKMRTVITAVDFGDYSLSSKQLLS